MHSSRSDGSPEGNVGNLWHEDGNQIGARVSYPDELSRWTSVRDQPLPCCSARLAWRCRMAEAAPTTGPHFAARCAQTWRGTATRNGQPALTGRLALPRLHPGLSRGPDLKPCRHFCLTAKWAATGTPALAASQVKAQTLNGASDARERQQHRMRSLPYVTACARHMVYGANCGLRARPDVNRPAQRSRL